MKKGTFILVLIFLANLSYAFDLVGFWRLKQIQGYPIVSQVVEMNIEDFIFRSSQVQYKITFTGCQSYKYQLQISDNNLFIKYNTFYLTQMDTKSNCSNSLLTMHSLIQSKLEQTFYFKIFGNYLVFLNSKQDILLRFQRKYNIKIKNIKGNWNILRINSKRVDQIVQITDNQVVACGGKLKIGYSFNGLYGLKTQLKNNTGCTQVQLQNMILASSFYRFKEVKLQFYDSNLDLIIQLQRLVMTNQPSNIPTAVLTNTKQDLVGKWQPVNVFGIPLTSSTINLIFTRTQISYNGGCNSYIFQYTVENASKSIEIGQNRSTSNNCSVNDDGLYVNAIEKISQYQFSVSGNQITMKIKDSSGNNVFQLRKNIESTTSSTQSFNQVNQPKDINSIAPGRYIFLILARRDLPRKFCTITENKIVYEGCNPIEHVYKVQNGTKIIIIGGSLDNKNCTNNNDQIIFNTFNEVVSFEKGLQTGSYVLKDSKNNAIINLSLF